MTISELIRLRTLLQWAKGKVFTDSLMTEICDLHSIVDREINLKTMDPRFAKSGIEYKDE